MKQDFDVLINGGGMVGGTMACVLAASGVRVGIIDHAAPQIRVADTYDGRASAIALASQRLLKAAGLWEDLEGQASPILNICVSDQQSPLSLHYDHRELPGQEPLGFMVENRHFQAALACTMNSLEGLSVLAPEQIVSLERPVHQIQATLASGRTITAKVIVGADGRASYIRKLAGFGVMRHDYAQSGIVCTVEHEQSHAQTAYERFLPSGPFAILPLLGNRSSIVWAERSDLARQIMALPDGDFQGELRQRFGDFLGRIEACGPRWCYPLSLQFTNNCIDHRLILAGDAVHAMHPLAGQGLNMGLRDVAAFCEVIMDARRLGLDIGTQNVLARYQRWRRFDNTLMLGATHGINSLFSNSIEPVRLARTLGLATVNRIAPLKKYFMRQAMGISGELPRLMLGQPL